MPRLTKVRMTNIQLDEGKKIISNSLWEPNAKDALFILENGGGKTSFIQLVTQTVLPNSNLSKRLLKEVLYKGTTGHIMTEWKLDGENLPYDYICLGFTFINGVSKSEELSYFSYFFTYKNGAELRIETLPAEQAGKVTRYQEYKKVLRQNDVRIFDVKREYKKELNRFHILEDEWKMIQKINGDEGGVDNYFKKAATTSDLLIKLLIPEVENTIFDTPEKKKEVQTYFKEYSKNLLSIPDMKRDLQDFQVIQDSAEVLVQDVEEYEKKKEAFNLMQEQIVRLKRSIEMEVIRYEIAVQELEEDKNNLNTEKKELAWKTDSYKVYTLLVEEAKKQQKLEKTQNELKKKEKDLKDCEALLNRWKAFQEYSEYLDIKLEVTKAKAELEAISSTNEELERERNEAKRLLNEAWICVKEEKEHLLEVQKKQVKEAESNVWSKENEKKRLLDDKEDIYGEWKTAHDVSEQYSREKKGISERYEEEASSQPISYIKKVLELLKESESIMVSLEGEKTNIQKWINQKRDWFLEASKLETKLYNVLEESQKKQDSYEEEKEKLVSMCMEEGKEIERLREEIEEILVFFSHEKVEREQIVDAFKQTVNDLDKKIQLWESHDFYIPDETLIQLQQRFEEKGLIVLLGSEWLSELEDEKIKERYLQRYPLLPYTFLIEESLLKKVKKVLPSVGEEMSNIPILFYVKSQLSLEEDKWAELGDFHEIYRGIWLYHQLDVQWFASKEKIEEMILSLKGERETNKIQLQFARDRFSEIATLVSHLSGFEATYPLTFESDIKKILEHTSSELKDVREEISSTKILIVEKEQSVYTIEQCLKKRFREQEQYRAIIQVLEQFVSRFPNPDDILSRPRDLKLSYEQMETKIGICDDELIELRRVSDEEKNLVRSIQSVLENLIKEKNRYGLDVEVTPQDYYSEEEKHSFIVRFEAAQKKYEDEAAGKVQLEGILIDKEGQLNKSQKRIKSIGYTIEEVREIYQETLGLEDAISNEEERLRTLSISVIDYGKEVTRIETILKEKRNQKDQLAFEIKEEYGWNPYIYNDTDQKSLYESFTKRLHYINKEQSNIHTKKEAFSDKKKDAMFGLKSYDAIDSLPQYKESYGLLSEEEIQRGKTFEKVCSEQVSSYKHYLHQLKKAESMVFQSFDSYVEKVNASKNPKVERFTYGLSKIRNSNKLFDSEYIIATFNRIFDTIQAYESDLLRKIEECEKDKLKLVELCYQRIESIYKNVMEIQKYSRVEVFGHELQIIKMKWERHSEEETIEHLHYHVIMILSTLQRMKKENKSEQEMNDYLTQQLENVVLLGKIAPLKRCYVSIYKPRKKSLMSTSSENWKPWDEVAKWSGGEEFSSYMSMFMILVTYLRKKVNAKDDSWKVIIADNPFGKASSEHVVKPIMELAKKSKIQLFCLTAHKNEDIRSHFECVMSNRYYNMAGIELMQVEHEQKEESVALGTFSYEHD
jgi:hypothetical protein